MMVWWTNVYIKVDQNITVLILVLVDDGMVGCGILKAMSNQSLNPCFGG